MCILNDYSILYSFVSVEYSLNNRICGQYYCVCRYGVGYHMVIVKEPSCDTAKV